MSQNTSADDPSLTAAQHAHQALQRAREVEAAALARLERAVRAAYNAHPRLGPTALAARIGISPSTLRGYTSDLARVRRHTPSMRDR